MQGSSRVSLAELKEFLAAQYDGAAVSELAAAGDSLLALVPILDEQRALRTTLADSSISEQAKAGIVTKLFGDQSELAVATVQTTVTKRWSTDADFVDAIEYAGDSLILMAAEKDDHIGAVEEEIFRFGRAIDANAELQMALTNPASSSKEKSGIVRTLLTGKSTAETVKLVGHVVESLRGRRVQDAIAGLSTLAAERRGQTIAEVRSAIDLSAKQRARLAAALSKQVGREVELNVIVDPAIVGGIQVLIGDELIDGSIASKLEQARRKLAG